MRIESRRGRRCVSPTRSILARESSLSRRDISKSRHVLRSVVPRPVTQSRERAFDNPRCCRRIERGAGNFGGSRVGRRNGDGVLIFWVIWDSRVVSRGLKAIVLEFRGLWGFEIERIAFPIGLGLYFRWEFMKRYMHWVVLKKEILYANNVGT